MVKAKIDYLHHAMKIKEKYLRWGGIPVLALIIALLTPADQGETFLGKYLISLLHTTVYWNVAFYMFTKFRKVYPLIRQTPKRVFFTLTSLFIAMVLLDPMLCIVAQDSTVEDFYVLSAWFDHALVKFIPTIIIGSIYENVYFFEQWKKTIQVNESLKNQQIRTQFEVLQNQMSPHFLFNSLNTLTTLIQEDPEVATRFTEKLSEVYRYILQNKEKELVFLHQELAFAKSYSFLLKMRYLENLIIAFNVEVQDTKHLPPLTLQMLIENALKHNIISAQRPLSVEIYSEGDNIIVKNNLQVKNAIAKSTKTGLDNIRRRYEYLSHRNIEVISDKSHFIVKVPLVEVYESQLTKAADIV